MKASERIKKIIELVPHNGIVFTKDLSNRFDVTEETIRRDLEKIEAMSVGIKKVHGGAYRIAFDKEVPIAYRQIAVVEEKIRMSEYCVSLMKQGSSIMLDSSTTASCIARKIREAKLQVNVITNSINVLREFENCKDVPVVCVGGALRHRTNSLVGYLATENLSKYHADIAFISCPAVHEEFGLTDHNESEAQVRKIMMKNSNVRYLVVDHTKFGKCFINHIGYLNEVNCIVTDTPIPAEWHTILSGNGIPYICC